MQLGRYLHHHHPLSLFEYTSTSSSFNDEYQYQCIIARSLIELLSFIRKQFCLGHSVPA